MKFKNRIILSVLVITFIPLILSYGIFLNDKIRNENEVLKLNLLEIGKLVAENREIQRDLENRRQDGIIDKKTDEYISIFRDVDIIVVTDIQGIKYSHLDKSQIGDLFVNPIEWDILKNKRGYFSQMKGSVGVTFRRFEPILSLKNGELLGFAMVGKYSETIFKMNTHTLLMFSLLFFAVSIISLLLAITFANNIKKTLFGLEPEDIGRLYREEKLITDNLIDGMRANIHEFKNKLHVILGLINLEKFDMAKKYILELQELNEYDFKKFKNIKNPFIKALLLGKNAVADERKIELIIDSKTSITEERRTEMMQDLASILGNLIENSFDSLKDSFSTDKKVRIKILETEREIQLEVWDNGEKIPHEFVHRIYEHGFSTKGNYRGMGLYIIKEKLKLYNGDIVLKTDRRGKTFKIKMEKKNEKSFSS